MRTRPPSAARRRRPLLAARAAAFSLVEASLAIGVVAFAFVALVGLLPAGLQTFRTAMDTSVGAQIAQRIAGELQETDFHLVVRNPAAVTAGAGEEFFLLPPRYFDDQGNETRSPEVASPAERQRILYTVRIRGSRPGVANPAEHGGRCFTSLPSADGARFNPRDVTFLTVQVVNNPGLRDLTPLLDRETLLIAPALARRQGLGVRTYPIALARMAPSPATTP